MIFKDTNEQLEIYNTLLNTKSDILINARAGCGKTTTVVNCVNKLPETNKICVAAFNVHIAKEIKEKLPQKNVHTTTTYGIGWGAILRKYQRKTNPVVLDNNKVQDIVNKASKKWDLSKVKNIDIYKENIVKLVGLAKVTLSMNHDQISYLAKKHLIMFERDDIKRVLTVLEYSLNDVKKFDYNDMVFLPAIDKKMFFFRYDYVFVDEFQDINKAQLAIIKKILARDEDNNITGRLIVVGDIFQSIYGFNGSDPSIMTNILSQFPNTIELSLTKSFRCSKNVIKKANELVPDIYALDDAIDGNVIEGDVIEDTEGGDFVLSRTMRPLIKLFFELLIKGKIASIIGIDFKDTLIGLFKKYDNPKDLLVSLSTSIDVIKKELMDIGITDFETSNQYLFYTDLRYAVDIIARIGKTKNQCIDYCNKIFSEKENAIKLSTIHRVKGLEARRVFIITAGKEIKPNLDWMKQEEENLKYVSYTRAKESLIFDYNWKDE